MEANKENLNCLSKYKDYVTLSNVCVGGDFENDCFKILCVQFSSLIEWFPTEGSTLLQGVTR